MNLFINYLTEIKKTILKHKDLKIFMFKKNDKVRINYKN